MGMGICSYQKTCSWFIKDEKDIKRMDDKTKTLIYGCKYYHYIEDEEWCSHSHVEEWKTWPPKEIRKGKK